MLITVAPTGFPEGYFVDTYDTREEAYQAMVEEMIEKGEVVDEFSSFTVNTFVRGGKRTYYVAKGVTDFGTNTDRAGLEAFRSNTDGGAFEYYKDTDNKEEVALRESLGAI